MTGTAVKSMDDSELITLLKEIESDRVERKASLANPGDVCKAICAFANDMPGHNLPGVIFIGVRDDGNCAGLRVTEELLIQLSDMRSNGNILSMPTMSVEKRVLNGCEIAVVIVWPSLFPPVRYKGQVWIRVGPRRAVASMEEERRLNERRKAADLPDDLRQITSASIKDLDEDFFRRVYLPSAIAPEVLRVNGRTLEQQMASLRFLTLGDKSLPTVVGIIAIGKGPESFLPGAYIQFLRINGTTLADPIADQKLIQGPIPDLMRQIDEIFRANIRIATDVRSASTEIQWRDYPLDALQQLVRNAVMHRDYANSNAPVRVTWFSDRIEMQNPGGPFGQVTLENFGKPGITDYRNPNVAEVMRNLGFVQKFGVGIQIARKALADNGNPAPVFNVEHNYILVTVWRAP